MSFNRFVENGKIRFYLVSLVFLIALVLRIGFTFINYGANGTDNWRDARLYLENGISFSQGDWYPKTSDRYEYMIVGPVVPLFVAGVKLVFGDPIWPMLVLNCLISSMMVFIMFGLGSTLINHKAGLILAVWAALNMGLVKLNYQILKEPFVITLVPLIVLMLVRYYYGNRPTLNIIFSALLFSILIHTDERFLVYAPIVFFILLMIKRIPQRVMKSLLWAFVVLLSMLPWTIRNYNEFGSLVIITPRTTAWTSKLWGRELASTHFSDSEYRKELNQIRVENAEEIASKEGLILREHGKYEKYWKAFIHYWKPIYLKTTFVQYGFRPIKWSMEHNATSMVFYGFFLPFYIYGFILAIVKKHRVMITLSLIPFIHSLMHTIMVWPLERYRMPVNCLIVLVALWCFVILFDRFCEAKFKQIAPTNNEVFPTK